MNIENLTMSFGTQIIFDDLSVNFNQNEKWAIVGVNGAGKSTLFNLLLGKIAPDRGKIIIKNNASIAYLPQVITDELSYDDITVFDYLLSARPIKQIKDEITRIYEEIGTEKNEKIINRKLKTIGKLEDKLAYFDEYNAENTLLKIIMGMNISDELLDLKVKNISGGQKSKVAFAKLLYSKPEIILLDEPTNHLDLSTKNYIINYLKKYQGLILVISHDIDFLNAVTNKTLYINKVNHSVTLYNGNYDKYLKIKAEREMAEKRLLAKQLKEEEKLKAIINKYIRGNEKKANIAKDRIKKLEKLQKEKVVLEKQNKITKFKMKINYKSYETPLFLKDICFGYKDNSLLYQNLSFTLTRGEKMVIIGENGIGKTTLLRLIMGYLTPISGSITINNKTNIAYYAQEHEILNANRTILENFSEYNLSISNLRKILGNFLFFNDDLDKKIAVLSPGERSRVALAKISLSGANTLLLDEPTNHLDPITQVIIAETFKDYEGTMLVVSHNLDFIDNLKIDRMLLLPSGKIMPYDPEIISYYENLNEQED